MPKEKPYKGIERTVVFVKPEAIQRHIIGEMISRFERRGLKMVACKLIAPTEEQIGKHYPDDEAWYKSSGQKTWNGMKERMGTEPKETPVELARETRRRLIEYFVDRPLILMIWEGPHAVALGRKTAGATNPLQADIGSIRGDYSMESYELADALVRPVHTLVHASGSPEEAEEEIKVWFNPDEILDYDLTTETVFYQMDWGRVKK